jgi:two-component system response regulator AgrA
MLDIYICEDNATYREFVASFISDFCIFRNLDATLALASADPYEILAHYKTVNNPSLFFLDIDLGAEINGIEVANRIRKQDDKAAIVFLTTHSELALLTLQYKIEALDFIIKGNSADVKKKIAECISIVYKRYAGEGSDENKKIMITVGDKIIPLDIGDIIYVETTAGHKLRLHTKNRSLDFNGELKGIEEQLDDRFVRCHKSYVINKDKISSINKKDNTVTMANNSTCPISRNGKKLLQC